jgi:hypothetical protein
MVGQWLLRSYLWEHTSQDNTFSSGA